MIFKLFFLGSCNTTTWIANYEDPTGIRLRVKSYQANIFQGSHQIPGTDPPISGTLEGDYTGLTDFPFLGEVQAFQFFPESCSIVMATTGHVFHNRDNDCPGNASLLKNFRSALRERSNIYDGAFFRKSYRLQAVTILTESSVLYI